ncbi:MAG: hypothetical protein HKN61_02850 [Flavobacteriaceae bacterium]|nr:hypothetical protein [Flavobacteriaceae bacterium]
MKKNWYYIVMFAGILWSCSGGDSGGNPPPPPAPTVPDPSAATLVFPDNNTECNEGEILNENQSRVTFRWNNAQNSDTYEVNLRELNSGNTSNFNSNTNSADITITRGAPYEWFVVSRANGTAATANSATWKFYNEGPGITNYAPFPAEAVNPARGANIDATSSVSLEWSGSDVDNDIVSYDVFFGTDPDPVTLQENTTETTLTVDISTDTVYYWKVVTNDSAGNSSSSEIFQFKVN